MKKIIILVSMMFLLGGCYDYKEINNLAFVSAVGIDFQNDKYVVTLEVLNDKIDKSSMKITTYTSTGEDKSLSKAIEIAADKITNQTNYSHTRLVVLSKSVTEEKLSSIADFFLRSTYFRENFFIVSALKDNPKDILETSTEENPVASTAIEELLESNNYASNSAVLKTFDNVIDEILTFGIDTCFSNISLDDKKFIIDGLVTYKDFEYAGVLDNNDATLYNILTDNVYRPIFSKNYDNKFFAVAIATSKPDIAIKEQNISIGGKVTGKIMDNEPEFNIRSLEQLKKINDDFSQIINTQIKEFIINLQKKQSDILGITKGYYQETRKKNTKMWLNMPVESKVEFIINKKGLIYEVDK